MINQTSDNNKRIAKNTIMLYFRMILIMVVNLYSSRVVLQVLGIEDYGTYNVVGGVVSMLSFITGSLGGAVSRFITFELGLGDKGDAHKMFRCSSTIFYIFAIISFVFLETIGLWFVLTQLNVPVGREVAVLWVYQCSIVSFLISLLSVTYNALIIAQEHMSTFAYISVFEAVSKLGILFLLYWFQIDRLILYSVLLMIIQVLIRILYTVYCKRKFIEADGRWLWDKGVSKRIFSYVGWTLGGHMSVVGYTQGINILLNIYFGPVVNASRAISLQIQSALSQFYSSFQSAIGPQVVKSYAQGNKDYMQTLVLKSARLSFLLSIIVSVPVFTFAEPILTIWLVSPPEHVVAFTRLTIIAGLITSLSQHTLMAIHATGDIKKFQVIESLCLLLVLPISWALLYFFHVSSEIVIGVYVIIEFMTQFVRVIIVYPKIQLRIIRFFTDILIPTVFCLGLSFGVSYAIRMLCCPKTFMTLMFDVILLMLLEIIICFMLGLNNSERNYILVKIKNKILC